MPTFNELALDDASGVVWLLDVSFNDFATIAYRWSTASVRVSGEEYDGRIESMTPIDRGFGRDHLPAATTTKLRIENTDFVADWLIDRDTVGSQLLKARFRLTAMLYESRNYADAASLSGASQVLGVFVCLDQPEAMESAIDLTLADDSLGRLAEPLTTPSVRDWKATVATLDPTLNPFVTNDPVPLMDWDVPLPLVFGAGALPEPQVPAYAAVAEFEAYRGPPLQATGGANSIEGGALSPVKWPIVVCAAKAGTQPPGVDEIQKLYGTYGDSISGQTEFHIDGNAVQIAGATVEIPRTFVPFANGIRREIWRPRRSLSFSKSGRDWQVVWVELDVDLYAYWFRQKFPDPRVNLQGGTVQLSPVPLGGAGSAAVGASGGLAIGSRGHIMAAFESFHVSSGPRGHLSVVTTRPSEAGVAPSQLLVDHIFDAIAYYSKATTADMDTTAWERAVKARYTVLGAGIIQPARPRPLLSTQRNGWISPNPRDGIVGILRTAQGDMCASADVDLFMTKEGLYSVATNVFDFTAVTAARTSIVESRTRRCRTRTPSDGERWAPYNRVMLIGPGGGSFGPYDNQEAIDDWGVIKPVTLNAKWNARLWGENSAAGASTVWAYRTLESKVRPSVRFNAGREYIALELGEYFEHTWSRGGQADAFFSGTVFRLEGMRIDPATLGVELSAIWADDLATDNPYLLDDEHIIVRVASSAGRTATVQDTNDEVTFASGDLTADGVEQGDILILRDATQAANVFSRNRAFLIDVITPTSLFVLDEEGWDYDAPTPVAVATWEIRRGKTTYPDEVSDVDNYPEGSEMYGKACDTSDEFSDSTAANKLLDG